MLIHVKSKESAATNAKLELAKESAATNAKLELAKTHAFNIKTALTDILGHDPNISEITKLIFDWNRSINDQTTAPKVLRKIDHNKTRIEQNLKHLKKCYYALERTKKFELYELNPFIKNPPDINNFTESLKVHIYMHETCIATAKFFKKDLFNAHRLMFRSIVDVFSYAEKIGVESNGKIGAGKGNKNKFLTFFSLITAIEDSKMLQRYHTSYKKWKTNPKLRDVKLDIPLAKIR